MFKLIKNIAADRKNSLPVADLHARYRRTGTPVVLGNLCERWPALTKWSANYLAKNVGGVEAPIYSNDPSVNGGRPFKPVFKSRLQVYLDELLPQKNDLRVSKLPLKVLHHLQSDFTYPRLGFDFNVNLTSLGIGGAGAMEPMRQSSSNTDTVHCHFGESASVLLIPHELSGFMYRVGNSQYSVRDIDFDQPQFDKYPALRNLSGYIAELNHGDALYIPGGFWFCIVNEGVGISLCFESIKGGAIGKSLISQLNESVRYTNSMLTYLENRTVSETNARLLKHQQD